MEEDRMTAGGGWGGDWGPCLMDVISYVSV